MSLITTTRLRPIVGGASAFVLLLAAGPAFAQVADAAPPQPALPQSVLPQPAPPRPATTAAASASQGVTAYPASFFAAQQPGTAMDMVYRLPGFTFDDGSNVRGFAGAAANVLINGRRPTSKSDDVGSLLSRLPAGQVERIEVIRGGAPGVDMQGKAVIANVVLKQGSGFTGVAAVATTFSEDGRMLPDYRLEGTWRAGDTRLEAGLNGTHYLDDTAGPGPRLIRDGSGAIVDRSQMQNRSGTWQQTGTAAWESPLAGGRLRVNAMAQDQAIISTYADDFTHAGAQYEKDTQDRINGELGLHWDRAMGPSSTVELIGLQHLNHTGFASLFRTPAETDFFGLRTTGGESIARAVLHYNRSDALTFEGGGEFAYNWVNTHTLFTQNGAVTAIPAGNVRVDERRGEVFTTATWRPSPVLMVEAGVRVEDSVIGSTGDVVLSKTLMFAKPRVLLTWSPDAADQLRLRVEREVGQLDFGSFAASSSLNGNGVHAGNPNLSPNQDWAFEAAYERRFWDKGAITLTARHMILKDVIDRVPIVSSSGVFDAPGNIGGGTENDLVASLSLPLDRLRIPHATITGVGTWRFSRVVDPTTGEVREISGQHQADAELHLVQDLPGLKTSWGLDAFRGWTEHYYRFGEIDTYKMGNWLGGFVEYKPKTDLAFRAEFSNFGRRPFDITRQVFPGLRTAQASPDLVDLEDRNFGMQVRLRARKTF
jgi:hypothetical protein